MKREIGNPAQADYSRTDAFAKISTFLGKIRSLFSAENLYSKNCLERRGGRGGGESTAGPSELVQGHRRLP